MTKKELKQYPMLCRQIEHLSNKIQSEKEKELDIVKGKVSGSSKHFPHIPVLFSRQGKPKRIIMKCFKCGDSIESGLAPAANRRKRRCMKQYTDFCYY